MFFNKKLNAFVISIKRASFHYEYKFLFQIVQILKIILKNFYNQTFTLFKCYQIVKILFVDAFLELTRHFTQKPCT